MTWRYTTVIGILLLLPGAGSSFAQTAKPQKDTVDTNRDARAQGPTADQQKENESDRKISQQIRQAVMKDKSLSTMAHNAKIITQNGMVTLRGAVRTPEEKSSLEQKAAAVVGAGKVTNELMVSPTNSTDSDANKATSKPR